MDPDRLLQDLGSAVRELRTRHGFTLRELAARAGLSARFLVQVESGRGNISVRNLAALAHALGSTPSALLQSPAAAPDLPVVALLGARGAGKTTIGRRLARRLRVPFVELDRRIEESAGISLGEIFALHGEDYYRRLEREVLEHLFSEGRPMVLATGGGIVAAPDTYTLLRRRALTVWLRADPEEHWNRVVQKGMEENPQPMAELRRLLATREPLYAEATHTVDTTARDPDDVAKEIETVVAADRAADPARR